MPSMEGRCVVFYVCMLLLLSPSSEAKLGRLAPMRASSRNSLTHAPSHSIGSNAIYRRRNRPLALRSRTNRRATELDYGEGFDDMTGNARFDETWIKMFKNKDRIRCPFWRRRAVDTLETVLAVARFILARHKRLDVQPVRTSGSKTYGLAIADIKGILEEDFKERNYYVTGKLSRRIYADNCYFDSPDPDTPVTGLRKYVDAISHLFDHKTSKVQLLDIKVLDDRRIAAKWRLEGTLMLPWRPKFKAYTGCTLYTLDDRGLVARHEEKWSISALDAFVSTVFPEWPFAAPSAPPYAELLRMKGHGAPDFPVV
mmetsp:Transcript_27102/g.37563  ORF Transcript_27102/g.37563 Transcript_27102/m.37563 type:complete len:313 (+) Transcript_27102:96-1034(+)